MPIDSIRMAARQLVEPRDDIVVFAANRRETVLKVVISESPLDGLSASRGYCLSRASRAPQISDETLILWSECGPTANERRGRSGAALILMEQMRVPPSGGQSDACIA